MQNPFSRDNPFVLKEKSRLIHSSSSGSIFTPSIPSSLIHSSSSGSIFTPSIPSSLIHSSSSGSIFTPSIPSSTSSSIITTLENNYFRPKQLKKRGKLHNPFFKKYLLSNLENREEQKIFGDIQYVLLTNHLRNHQKQAQKDQQKWRREQVVQSSKVIINIPIRSTHKLDSNIIDSNRIDSNRIDSNRIESKRSAAYKEATERREREILEKVELNVEMKINQQVRKGLKDRFMESRKEIEPQGQERQIRLRGKIYTRCEVVLI